MSRLMKQVMVASLALTIGASNANANLLDSFFGGLFGPGGNRTAGPRQQVKIRGGFNPGDIIVSFGDRRLYYIDSKASAISYAIAIPKEEARWSGVSYVSQKRENPVWTYVAGGDPRNPLGTRALYLGDSMYRIHGTDAPWLIGQQVSHGCIRMYNEDAADLYRRAKVGAKVVVTWNHMSTM